MKKLFIVLAALMTVPALYAAEDTPIQNVCDSLSLGGQPVIELVPAYIDESNWYGNPRTWAKDSSNAKRHETYETVTVSISKSKTMQLPISINAGCLEKRGLEVGYAKWNTDQTWSRVSEDDFATRIYTMRELSMEGHDASNTSNLLAFVPGMIPDNLAFSSSQLLYSVTFEFAFEYWFASASYQHKYRNADDPESTVRASTSYVTASGNDSLKVVNLVVEGLAAPDTIKSIRIQTLKVVLVDSRKPLLPQSSSSVVESSSSEEESSSSNAPVSSSTEEESSSSVAPASSSSEETSSSSETPDSSSDAESSSSEEVIVSSSSNTEVSSSGNADESSSSENVGPDSSSDAESSSSEEVGPASSADAESSSSETVEESSSSESPATSSSAEPESSSSEGTIRLVTEPTLDGSARMVQVRTLDGSIVKNSGNLAPGVYYVKYSNGKWRKMAVLPR